MGEVVQFVSRAKAKARENLDAFVQLARNELTAFSDGGAWDETRWRNGGTTVVFCKHRPRRKARSTPIPLTEPFLTFAKAYLRYQYSHKPVRSLGRMISAIRMIELALLDASGRADILDLSVPVLDLSARYCAEHYVSKQVQYQAGRQIEALADFCREKRLVPALPAWKSPFRKQLNLTETLTEEGARHRENKLPSHHSMLALADLFAQADDVEAQYFTSIMAMMMVAPSRISEVLALPLDCMGWEEDTEGNLQMYLRWRAAKGGGPMKKWVPTAMQSVVEEAVNRLARIGAPARAAAKFAYEHPGRFMRHASCTTPDDFGEDEELSPSQVAAAVGVRFQHGHGWAGLPPSWARLGSRGPVTYRVLADMAAKRYSGRHWPYMSARKEVPIWESLCLIREYECHNAYSLRPFSWRLPRAYVVNNRLGRNLQYSLFERAGLRNPDGSPIKLTTHQLRHWLSTMSARAGMDDYTLAQWAGRARIEDNRHYDHRTQHERSAELRPLLRRKEPTVLDKVRLRQPVTYEELGVDRPGTAHTTLYGMCLHDYSMSPCQKQRDCMTCKNHICIKGDHVTLDRIKRLEVETADLLEKAREAAEAGEFGANRWVDNHAWKLTLVRTTRTLLEDESVPDGTVLRMPGEYDPSPVRRTLMDLGLINAPTTVEVPLPPVSPAIEGPDNA